MSTLRVFDGTGDVLDWEYQMKSKLTAKEYRPQLADINRPTGNNNLTHKLTCYIHM